MRWQCKYSQVDTKCILHMKALGHKLAFTVRSTPLH